MTNRALLVVDMQNGFCHPDGSFPVSAWASRAPKPP